MPLLLLTTILSPAHAAQPIPGSITNSIGMLLVPIPAGEFVMGTPQDRRERLLEQMKQRRTDPWYQASVDGEIQRRIRITRPFHMGAYEVTLGQFRQFVEATGYRTDAERDGKGADGIEGGRWQTAPRFNWRDMGYERPDDTPVVNVTWNDVVAFCKWLSEKEGAVYRLPTEAEWEYACRAGSATLYYWGDEETPRNRYVWHGGNSGGRPRPVGRLEPNAWGLYDMLGNVYEYCSDRYSRTPNQGDTVDPKGPASGTEIVVRSGSWGTDPMHCRSAFRGSAPVDHRNMRDGFRVVRAGQ